MTTQDLRDALQSVVEQFAFEVSVAGIPCITTGGLSALEEAFAVLGWKDPYPTPERKCEKKGCDKHASCGTPTKNGYKRLCGKHYKELGV